VQTCSQVSHLSAPACIFCVHCVGHILPRSHHNKDAQMRQSVQRQAPASGPRVRGLRGCAGHRLRRRRKTPPSRLAHPAAEPPAASATGRAPAAPADAVICLTSAAFCRRLGSLHAFLGAMHPAATGSTKLRKRMLPERAPRLTLLDENVRCRADHDTELQCFAGKWLHGCTEQGGPPASPAWPGWRA
jgi:hypothetical protein